MFEVIYEDNHLLVVVKPVNVPAQADSSGDMDMLSLVKAYIKEEYQKPGAVYAGLVHRLDRPAGGLMVFAKTSKAAARLSAQFQSHEAGRSYLAAVEGDAGAGTLTDYLCKDGRKNRVMVVREGTAGAKWARLCYETVERRGGLSLVRVGAQHRPSPSDPGTDGKRRLSPVRGSALRPGAAGAAAGSVGRRASSHPSHPQRVHDLQDPVAKDRALDTI